MKKADEIHRSTRLSPTLPNDETQAAPSNAKPLSTPLGGSAATRHVLGNVATRVESASAIDGTAGTNLRKALGKQTLASAAANSKHQRKMEQSAELVGAVEKFPGNLSQLIAFSPARAFALYTYCFPNDDEREDPALIKERVRQYEQSPPADGSNFHALGIADKEGNVIGYTQGSVVPCDAGLFFFWQYGCVADRTFMQKTYDRDINPRDNGILNTIHGVNGALLNAAAEKSGRQALGSLWESEPRGLGEDQDSIKFTSTRLSIHNRAGGRVMMGQTADGSYVNLHLQPRLSAEADPIALHIVYRPTKYDEGEEFTRGALPKADAEAMMMAWIDNFRREGFGAEDVAAAEKEIRERFAKCERIVLLPADQVPDVVTLAQTDDILRQQIFDMYGVDNLDAARRYYDRAMLS